MKFFWHPRTSLQTKLLAVTWLMTTIGTITAAIVSSSLLIRSHRESIHAQLQTTATSLISLGISDFSELEDFEGLNDFILNALKMEKIDKIVRIYNKKGALVFTTIGVDYDHLPSQLKLPIPKPQIVNVQGQQRMYASLIVPYETGRKRQQFYLQVAIPLPPYADILSLLWVRSLILFGLLILVSFFISWYLAKKLIQPVRFIAEHLKSIDPTKAHELKPLHLSMKGDFLDTIVEGMNLLILRTQKSLDRLQKMSRYVAHELRTPLTILRGEAELVLSKQDASREEYAQTLKSSLEEIDRMSDIVAGVLSLDERKKMRALTQESYDLRTWIQKNVTRWEKTLGRSLCLDLPSTPQMTRLDPTLLYHLVDNLIRNVHAHTSSTTICTLFLKADSSPTLFIYDDGPGVSVQLLTALNASTDELINELGIGTHLCKKIAELCDLHLAFANRPEGGFLVTIEFPASLDLQTSSSRPLCG
ncbi:MAG: hypothetical protein A3I05_07190 [Deltaproteobacteria bacterium RIFCSPLOWO2_02_FULL_44_10]|nr:MAG: hypothetical protein A3C46_04170 [Deltaproteobacteria bacterium RIFCSPHIGHO2_02_FULL_44_16]OGQ46376.1 MAG: hypothetical protein A3I05_07190 [Deltaproteobacteria bacterium RIFCSPLOWO2_02_FULL_44_10]